MAGVTDYPFRSFMKKMNCGVLTTELVSAAALVLDAGGRGACRTQRIAQFHSDQRPVGIQIFGENPEMLAEAAYRVEQMGADFVDLNLGCPVPKIVKKGAGSAVLKDLSLLSCILKLIRKKISIPLTIKVRTGWGDHCRNSLEAAQIAYDEGCLWMTIHGRTRAQGYSGLSDWNYISEVKSKAKIPIIGNGDLTDPYQIREKFEKTQCNGLMIGRGALRNPFIFNEAYCLLQNQEFLPRNYSAVLKSLYQCLDSFYDDRMTLIQLKKFSAWFSSGYPESAVFRKNVFQLKEKLQVLELTLEYFQKWGFGEKGHSAYESFLMQGHG